MKDIFKSVFVIIGTVIGAGFASGKEIYIFFSKYGFNGLLGIIIASILFFLIVWKILDNAQKYNITEYNDLKINSQIKHIMAIFLLSTFYIMIAGFAAFIEQEFSIPIIIGSTVVAIICYITFTKGVDGIIKVNTILIPILIAVLIHTCYKNVDNQVVNMLIKSDSNINGIMWIIGCLEYVGYNSIILIPILLTLKKSAKSSFDIAIISAILFGIMAIGIHILSIQSSQEVIQLEIPIIGMIRNYEAVYKYIFQVIIIIAIYTSAISAGYGFIKSINQGERYIKVICISSVFIAFIGFSSLVKIFYPVFGILGIWQLYEIIFKQKL